ncbi:hypothetical protein PPYR_03057 [Photinus pyralis]|uniref:Serine/threonine-protein phosphatase PGAM5, mitochondrial n=1 Tax=Photinus pyralis TaxID=7054 RepID=A0A5N4A1Q5_PHOPY|nr:serine/threonine-protein phosphatase PGAM5, mitochondrial-like isoform X1 [Photinus pyralis]KAB0791257.1 hypothetical protein PPYR_03057 [Photinus pyralis]
MSTFTKMQKVALGLGTVGGSWCFFNFFNADRKVFNSWTTNFTPSVKWDDNWDHRSPTSLVHPKLFKLSDEKGDNQINENKERATPKVNRHIILIRHGQYNMSGETDKERYLTALGRSQAEYTGKRLLALGFPYTSMIKSTMTRAQETGSIISASLDNLPVSDCNLIREGAPIPPEPPVGHWRPEKQQFYQDGARIEAGFREYFYRADASQEKETYMIMVCHANVIRYFVCRALQFPAEAWLRISLNHGSITWLTITPKGRVILRALGDSGHMPVDAITY